MKKRAIILLLSTYSISGMHSIKNHSQKIPSLFDTAAPLALDNINESLENKTLELSDIEFLNQLSPDKITTLKKKLREKSPDLTADLLTITDHTTLYPISVDLKQGMPLSYHKGTCFIQTPHDTIKCAINPHDGTITTQTIPLMQGNIVRTDNKTASWNKQEYHREEEKHSRLMFHINHFRKVAGIVRQGILVVERDKKRDTLQILDENTRDSLKGICLKNKILKTVIFNNGKQVLIQQVDGKLILWNPAKNALKSVVGLTENHLIAGAYKDLILIRNRKNSCLELWDMKNFQKPFYTTQPISNYQRGTLGKHDNENIALVAADPKSSRVKILLLNWPTDHFTLTELIKHNLMIKQQNTNKDLYV